MLTHCSGNCYPINDDGEPERYAQYGARRSLADLAHCGRLRPCVCEHAGAVLTGSL